MTANNNNIANLTTQFEQASKEFEAHWEMGREAAKSAAIKINEMVSILHKQYINWSINKIAQYIWSKHEHLEGFSRQTIYNKLDDENRQLIDNRFSDNNRRKLQSNNTEHSVLTLEPNITEDSPSKKILPTAYDIKGVETITTDLEEPEEEEEQQKQYNDLKEGYITTFTQGLAGKLSESEVREIVEGVFEEPSIMKEFEEAYQYAEEPSELPQFTKHFEEWMSSVGSGITEKLAEVTVN